ncbi:LPS export ABC transporter periplasmic protein LptC [Okeania sp. SIO1I7]|uniref:LPS export ABC transporter periplasmic protein LptC n=1 Tax=Okeania sp. SIO1I7 TaxID=2607772 RepID=UPI0013F7458B|nr:LPS export ABC transporter periplasmic protein LptC [Okeania sp. SIO1I7]NET28880.1 LPS export ABC transporter periplasmic protein LptC [Okeania sp. SIO1I7]
MIEQNNSFSSYHNLSISLFILVTLLLGITACNQQNQVQENISEQPIPTQTPESDLTLNDVTLEEASEEGQMLWRVKSQRASYLQNQELIRVTKPEGELFQDGKVTYKITALQGEVYQDGNKIILIDEIEVYDIQNKVVIRGQQLEWLTEPGIIIVTNNITGSNEQVQASAQKAKVISKEKKIEFYGQVVAMIKEPVLKIQTEQLFWQIEPKKLLTNQPIKIEQLQDKKVIGSAYGDESEYDLDNKIATLKKNVQLLQTDPKVQISSELVTWNMPQNLITSPGPITVLEQEEKVVLKANQGQGNFQNNTFNLSGNVIGVGQNNQAQLNSDRLTWYFENQTFEAQGNVFYRQVDPPFNVRGPRAVGQLENEKVTIEGGSSNVVTEIIPQ